MHVCTPAHVCAYVCVFMHMKVYARLDKTKQGNSMYSHNALMRWHHTHKGRASNLHQNLLGEQMRVTLRVTLGTSALGTAGLVVILVVDR